ncbi:MAG: signal recognition particle-docking protein FtsY [Armatimonadetes bacterium]|nr:signal recognition particle-docking protein FtsY [Armatimonadota bacterium]
MRFLRNLVQRFTQIFQRSEVDEELLDELEEALILADVGMATTGKLMGVIRESVKRNELKTADEVKAKLKEMIADLLSGDTNLRFGENPPTVWLFVGVNGTGKTTTIAKFARWLQKQGKKPLLVAADTFRAAAIDQLKVWGERLRVPVIAHQMGADPAAVAFDGIQAAKARGYDVVLIDTAGRMHTKQNLLEEMRKIYRVAAKALEREPDEVLLILDGTTGQNAIAQAEGFTAAVPVSGIIVTKLDGTAKGGAVLAIKDRLGIPIKAVGVGETADDLELFDPEAFASALLGENEQEG